jgi:hypothetical protein
MKVYLLSRNEKLVEKHNKKINQQLNHLSNIQDQIELNDELTLKQLIGFFVLIQFLGIQLLLIITKTFSSFAELSIVGYVIYMIVVRNQSDKINFKKEDNRTKSKYER